MPIPFTPVVLEVHATGENENTYRRRKRGQTSVSRAIVVMVQHACARPVKDEEKR
jgi:hypothetical protein